MFYLYRITNQLNNKMYIGQSNKEKERWRQHKYFGRNPEKTGQYIHRAMNKYGVENFIYEVIATCCTNEDANETEKQLISQYDSRNPEKGYNVAPGGDSPWNLGLSKELNPLTGIPRSEEIKKKISKGNLGKIMPKHTDEWKSHMSEIMSGRLLPIEQVEKIAASNRGKKRSLETKKKLSNSHSGEKHRLFGKHHSEETKEKIAKANTGFKHDEKTKLKMSQSSQKIRLNRRLFTYEQEIKILEEIKSGLKIKDAAEKFCCSIFTIRNIIKRNEL